MFSCNFNILILCECNYSEVVDPKAFMFGMVIGHDMSSLILKLLCLVW
jgi:hypothetical protein